MESLSYRDQMQRFIDRNMVSKDPDKDALKLKNVSYYKLKEIAKVFARQKRINGETVIDYNNVNFSDILSRFYQDKNLRINLLHVVEEIEISIKTRVSYVLGRDNYGAYGYLHFSSWCNRNNTDKFNLAIKENEFKKKLAQKVKYSENSEVKKQTRNTVYPSVWLMVDLLTFGETINLLKVMSSNNLKKIANGYNMSPNEFLSKIRCIHLIRNICAHNSSIVDIKLKTVPTISENAKPFLFKFKNGEITNRIAVPITVIFEFINIINPNYRKENIIKNIKSICHTDFLAQQFGYVDKKASRDFLDLYAK